MIIAISDFLGNTLVKSCAPAQKEEQVRTLISLRFLPINYPDYVIMAV